MFHDFDDKENCFAFPVCVAWWCLGEGKRYGPRKMSCITFSSDNMTKVYADRVIVIQFCNSLGVCCIPTGGGGPPWTPSPPPAQATPWGGGGLWSPQVARILSSSNPLPLSSLHPGASFALRHP